jgi:DNA replication protein DnaC
MAFVRLIQNKHGKTSNIIAGQLPVADWYDVIREQTIAEAILDRLVHTSYRIGLKGESLIKKK